MTSRCGLVICQCMPMSSAGHYRHRLGRVHPAKAALRFFTGPREAVPQVLVKIRQLEETRRVAALYRSHPEPKPSEAFVSWLRKVSMRSRTALPFAAADRALACE